MNNKSGGSMLKKKKAKPKAKRSAVKKARPAAKKPVRKPVKKSGRKGVKKAQVKKLKNRGSGDIDGSLEKIGEVTHYFPKVRAAAVKIMKSSLKIGDKIRVKGHTTDFTEKVTSIQLDRAPIEVGTKGDEIGLMVKSRVRRGDDVYKIA